MNGMLTLTSEVTKKNPSLSAKNALPTTQAPTHLGALCSTIRREMRFGAELNNKAQAKLKASSIFFPRLELGVKLGVRSWNCGLSGRKRYYKILTTQAQAKLEAPSVLFSRLGLGQLKRNWRPLPFCFPRLDLGVVAEG